MFQFDPNVAKNLKTVLMGEKWETHRVRLGEALEYIGRLETYIQCMDKKNEEKSS